MRYEVAISSDLGDDDDLTRAFVASARAGLDMIAGPLPVLDAVLFDPTEDELICS